MHWSQTVNYLVLLPVAIHAGLRQMHHDLKRIIPQTVLNSSFIELQDQIVEYQGRDVYARDHIHVTGKSNDRYDFPIPNQWVMLNGTAVENTNTEDVSWLVDDLMEYGCWCYFMEAHIKGRGHPVNEVDVLCKALSDGYTCTVIDFKVEGKVCYPWAHPYISAYEGLLFPFLNTEEELILACEQNNLLDGCAREACILEGTFIRSIILAVTLNGGFDGQYKHSNGFDVEEKCPHTEGGGSDRICCGSIPYRFPFSSKNTTRSCCGNNVFDLNMFECCEDGSVQFACAA